MVEHHSGVSGTVGEESTREILCWHIKGEFSPWSQTKNDTEVMKEDSHVWNL